MIVGVVNRVGMFRMIVRGIVSVDVATPSNTAQQWTEIYAEIFKSAFEECGCICERAQAMTGHLLENIIEKLVGCPIVLAYVTDRNLIQLEAGMLTFADVFWGRLKDYCAQVFDSKRHNPNAGISAGRANVRSR